VPEPLRITAAHLTRVASEEGARGLLGWARVELNGMLALHSVAIRRSRRGRLVVSFPRRRDRRGRSHCTVAPLSPEAHATLERAILELLVQTGGLP
jgi:DNA-binding cell septation regulator SpoVG